MIFKCYENPKKKLFKVRVKQIYDLKWKKTEFNKKTTPPEMFWKTIKCIFSKQLAAKLLRRDLNRKCLNIMVYYSQLNIMVYYSQLNIMVYYYQQSLWELCNVWKSLQQFVALHFIFLDFLSWISCNIAIVRFMILSLTVGEKQRK